MADYKSLAPQTSFVCLGGGRSSQPPSLSRPGNLKLSSWDTHLAFPNWQKIPNLSKFTKIYKSFPHKKLSWDTHLSFPNWQKKWPNWPKFSKKYQNWAKIFHKKETHNCPFQIDQSLPKLSKNFPQKKSRHPPVLSKPLQTSLEPWSQAVPLA